MAYRHRKNGTARRTAPPQKVAQPAASEKKEPGALEKLHEMTEHTDFLESRKKDFVPKPRAVRRYERYSSMGGDG